MTAAAARILALEAEVADLRRQLQTRRGQLAGMDSERFGDLIREWAAARREARSERTSQQIETSPSLLCERSTDARSL